MKDAENRKAPRRGEKVAILAILAAILLLFTFFLKDIMIPLIRLQLARDMAGVQALLADKGLLGGLSVMLVEALQMVVIFIPAEFIQISSGLSYPLYVAVPLCDLGVCLGATIIFLLVRLFKFRSSLFERRRGAIERVSAELHERNSVLLLYLLFFMPIIPFGAICYYGSGKLPYHKYILTVATGVLPSILVPNFMGAAGTAFLVNGLPLWLLVLIILLLAALLFALILVFIRRVCFRGADGTPDSMTYAFLFFVARLWLGRRQRPIIDDEALRAVEAPYVMLCNHESFEDFYYIHQMAHPLCHDGAVLREPGLVLRGVIRRAKLLGVGQDHRKGRFQLVGGVGNELGLLLPGPFRGPGGPSGQQKAHQEKDGEAAQPDEHAVSFQGPEGAVFAGHVGKDDVFAPAVVYPVVPEAVVFQQACDLTAVQRALHDIRQKLRVREIVVTGPVDPYAAEEGDAHGEVGEAGGGARPVEPLRVAGHGAQHVDAFPLQILLRELNDHAEDDAQQNENDGHGDGDKPYPKFFQHDPASRWYPSRRTDSIRTSEPMLWSFFRRNPM